jgi:hypothetical protein
MALTDWLIAYYKLDWNSNDSVGTNNGTDTAITYSAGKIGQCAGYTNSTSKIVITENTSMALTEFSISFWFQIPDTTWFKPLFRRSGAFMQGYLVYVSGNSVIGLIGNGADISTAGQTVVANTWYKWLLRWSNTTKVLSLRINNGTPVTVTTGANIVNSGTLNFLYDVPNITAGNAKLDEVWIWNRVISDSEDDILWNGWAGLSYPFTLNSGGMFNFFFS